MATGQTAYYQPASGDPENYGTPGGWTVVDSSGVPVDPYLIQGNLTEAQANAYANSPTAQKFASFEAYNKGSHNDSYNQFMQYLASLGTPQQATMEQNFAKYAPTSSAQEAAILNAGLQQAAAQDVQNHSTGFIGPANVGTGLLENLGAALPGTGIVLGAGNFAGLLGNEIAGATGLSSTAANTVGGAVTGAITHPKDPLTGAITGGVLSGVQGALGGSGASVDPGAESYGADPGIGAGGTPVPSFDPSNPVPTTTADLPTAASTPTPDVPVTAPPAGPDAAATTGNYGTPNFAQADAIAAAEQQALGGSNGSWDVNPTPTTGAAAAAAPELTNTGGGVEDLFNQGTGTAPADYNTNPNGAGADLPGNQSSTPSANANSGSASDIIKGLYQDYKIPLLVAGLGIGAAGIIKSNKAAADATKKAQEDAANASAVYNRGSDPSLLRLTDYKRSEQRDPLSYLNAASGVGTFKLGGGKYAGGGLASLKPLPGQERKTIDRRSVTDSIRKMYGSKREAVMDLGDPQSPLHSMGVRDAKDPILDAAFRIVKAAGGRYIDGAGDGLSDSIPARIDGKQEAALASGEFVVSADTVADIGNGSSSAGAKKLHTMMQQVRKAKHGTTQQPKAINAHKVISKSLR